MRGAIDISVHKTGKNWQNPYVEAVANFAIFRGFLRR